MRPEGARMQFDVPDGRLCFSAGDLDLWAEHLSWCYGFLGVEPGATIAVQDFGSSPLCFLGSAMLMPGLEKGVAERLGGRYIGLDASPERCILTPSILDQVDPDVLVVRAEVLPLVSNQAARSGGKLERPGRLLIVAGDGDPPPPNGAWRWLLHVEAGLLIAPMCSTCESFHLEPSLYQLTEGQVTNRRLPCAGPALLPRDVHRVEGICERGLRDLRVRFVEPANADGQP